MTQPYIGEIRLFAGNFAPNGWLFCDGQELPISWYEDLFMLIGTTYGGDGQTTFVLPDLRGRAPIHYGQGPALSDHYLIGESGGVERVTITVSQMPAHSHTPLATNSYGSNSPSNAVWARSRTPIYNAAPDNSTVAMLDTLVQPAGGGLPHDNMAPFLTVSFIIAAFGIFPSQT